MFLIDPGVLLRGNIEAPKLKGDEEIVIKDAGIIINSEKMTDI